MMHPPFENWVEYCFTLGHADFSMTSGDDEEMIEARQDRFEMDPPTLCSYMTKLLETPADIADRYSDEQIGEGVWYLFGVASCSFLEIWSKRVQKRDQLRCMASVLTMYTQLFDRVCGKRGQDPDGKYSESATVDGAVYMIWDMDSIDAVMHGSYGRPDLAAAALDVLEQVLSVCRTGTCLQSALHGLGHAHTWHSQRVEQIVDGFLAAGRGPDWIREYASQARTGCVQ